MDIDSPSEGVPLEMWNAILHFLDCQTLAVAQRVCKEFYHLAVREEHWKKEALGLFSSNITPYYQAKYCPNSTWRNLIKDMQQHDVTGSWEIYIRLDDHFDVFTISGRWDIINNLSRFCSKILHGFGSAPWGSFSSVGCNIGPYYSLLHTYNEGAYYSSYIGTIDEDAKHNAKIIYGPYKTNWEDLTGSYVAINSSSKLDRKQVIEILRERFLRINRTRDQAYEEMLAKFAGKSFEVSFAADEACLKDNNMSKNFKFTFRLSYSNNKKGLKGFIVTTDRGFVPMALIKSSLVLATISDNMIQASFVVYKAQQAYTTITALFNFELSEKQVEISENGVITKQNSCNIILDGSYVWSDNAEPLNYGKVFGHSIDDKSSTNKQQK